MSDLKDIRLEFKETMSGWLGIAKKDYVAGRIAGQQENTPLHFDARIIIDDLDRFIKIAEHWARLEGTVTFKPWGGTFAMEDGSFNLFSVEPTEGIRQLIYSFGFTAANGKKYFLAGHKNIKDNPGFDLVKDMTTLFTKVYEGADATAPCYGSGQVFFDLKDALALLVSMKVTGTKWLHQQIQARLAFLSFAWGVIRQEYLR
jgi:cholesterol oxidase